MPPSTRTPSASPWNRRIHATRLNPIDFAPFGSVIQNPDAHGGVPKLDKAVANQGSATKWLDVTRMRDWYGSARSKRGASCVMNMFVCRPRELRSVDGQDVFDVRILERHPFTAQTFVPMGLGREDRETYYLVIVAPTLPAGKRSGGEERQPPYPTSPPVKRKRSLKDRLLGARPSPYTNDYAATTTPPTLADSEETQPKGTGPPDLDNIKAFIARGDQAVTYGPGTWHAPMVVLGERPIDFVVIQYANGVGEEDCQEFEIEADEVGVLVEEDGVDTTPRAKL